MRKQSRFLFASFVIAISMSATNVSVATASDLSMYDRNGNYSYGNVDSNGNVNMYDRNGNYSYGNINRNGNIDMYDRNGNYSYGNKQ